VGLGIDKPSQRLQDVASLDPDALAAEVKKVRGRSNPLSVAEVKRLKEEHAGRVVPPRRWPAKLAHWKPASPTWSTPPNA
jgi:hypothetical protein